MASTIRNRTFFGFFQFDNSKFIHLLVNLACFVKQESPSNFHIVQRATSHTRLKVHDHCNLRALIR